MTAVLSHESSARATVAASDTDRTRRLLVTVLLVLIGVTVMQRLAVPGSGGLLGVGFVLCFAVSVLALLNGQMAIDPVRLVLYLLALATLLATLFFQRQPFSQVSFVMLAAMYLPAVLAFHFTAYRYRLLLEVFQRVAAFSAIAGLVQFALQIPFGPAIMWPLDLVLPEPFFLQGFNLRIPVGETGLFKSTGLFFLEPSIFSQILALAIVVELIDRRRPLMLALFGVAYLSTFSGSGALMLAALGLPLLIRARRQWLLAPAVLCLLAAPLLQDVPPFSFFFGRLEELDRPMASGSMRFIAPYWLVADVLWSDPRTLLFGFGPGSVDEIIAQRDYAVQDSSWLKLLIEYGLVGTVGFFTFYLWVLFRHAPDRLLAFACLFQFLFLGGYLNAYYVQFLHMALVIWPRLETAATFGDTRRAHEYRDPE
ncbi:MAG: hypothetical protein KDE35_14365 [Geminicoccaceae bacterium]|nr:hypothetical protein [Geminicoccaceae bacterium]